MNELNLGGEEFIREWNKVTHSTTKKIPDEFFKNEEIKAQLPLPNKRFRLIDIFFVFLKLVQFDFVIPNVEEMF